MISTLATVPTRPAAQPATVMDQMRGLICVPMLAMAMQDPFTEEAVVRGVDYSIIASGTSGQGMALCDLDRDLDLDLVVTGRADGVVGVYENDGTGIFIDRTTTSGLEPIPYNSASGVAAADYDGDGLVDLYFSNANTPNRLVRNVGDFEFIDVSLQAGVADFGFGAGCAWADYDGDGYLDLYLANNSKLSSPSADKLYRNRGDGTFEIMGNVGIENRDLQAWQAIWFDYDLDGDPDLYISNDKGEEGTIRHNYLWENVGGTFIDATEESDTHAYADSMGVAVGDFDQNGYPDLYCSNIGANPLFLNVDGTTFRESAFQARVTSDSTGWGTVFFDFDNDATLDLYVCNFGDVDRLYSSANGWPCSDQAVFVGLGDTNLSYCVAMGDIDDDGDLDIVHSAALDQIRVFVNQNSRPNTWVKVLLRQPGRNRNAVGARVVVTTSEGEYSQQVLAGVGYKSSLPFMLHFGLGEATTIQRISVTWPDGARTAYTDLDVDRTAVIGRRRGLFPAAYQ
ncbi:MAG: hypothetical protein ACI8QZ_000965 [Chlamydiales bacterium]|jgi:hypothetical protein